MNKFAAFLFLTILCTGFAAHAQSTEAPAPAAEQSVDPERLAAARSLLELTHSDQMAAQIMKQFSANITAIVVRDNPDQQKLIQGLIDTDLTPIFISHTHEMQENSAMAYARHFTVAELNELSGFYRSPTGQKYLQTMPQILGETMKANRALVTGIIAEASSKLAQDLRKNNLHVPKEMGI